MIVYLVEATDCEEEESFISEIFSNKEEAEKYAAFKNQYKTPWYTYYEYIVKEKEVLEKADLALDEDRLCVEIDGYIHFSDDEEDEIEYNILLREDWCSTNYRALRNCISFNIFIDLTKEEYDNFDRSKYDDMIKELKEKILKMHEQGIDEPGIADLLSGKALT